MGGPYSVETKSRFEAYLLCFARGAYDRRNDPRSPEARMQEAKAACRTEYDSFVAGVVADSEGLSDAATAEAGARALLDEMDARAAAIGPAPPAALAQLPVAQLVGGWRMGNGPLAVQMNVRFADDGSLLAILSPAWEFTADGLQAWRVVGDGTEKAVLHASFGDGRVVRFEQIPSFPSEMNFINPADPSVQRIDLATQDDDLLIRLVTNGGGTQLRFRRDLGTEPGAAPDY